MRLGVDDQTPHRLVSHGIEEGQVVPADPTTQDVLQHVAVEEQRAHLVLEQAETDDSVMLGGRARKKRIG